jgi:hypothetical protein
MRLQEQQQQAVDPNNGFAQQMLQQEAHDMQTNQYVYYPPSYLQAQNQVYDHA